MNMVQVINRGAYGISDDALADERKAQALMYAAVAQMRSALQDALILSDIRHDQILAATEAFNTYLHDDFPDRAQWDEALAEARHP